MSKIANHDHAADAVLERKSDEDELVQNLRFLTTQRENVSEVVKQLQIDCDKLMELLLCSTNQDVKLITEELFALEADEGEKFQMSSEEEETFVNRISLLENFNMQKIFGIGIHTVDKHCILAQFSALTENEDVETSLVNFKRENDFRLKLEHFVIPNPDEVKIVEETYLNKESQDVPSFMYFIQQCLLSFWTKALIIEALKNEKYVNESKIYCNKARTLISFLLNFKDRYIAEYKLHYDLISIYPYKVQYRVLNNCVFPDHLTYRLEELKKDLLNDSVQKAINHLNETEETSSSSTSL